MNTIDITGQSQRKLYQYVNIRELTFCFRSYSLSLSLDIMFVGIQIAHVNGNVKYIMAIQSPSGHHESTSRLNYSDSD